MIGTMFQAVLAFVLTGIVGAWIANFWQTRSAKDTRFFEASKSLYGQMEAAASELASLVGKRIYATQRICLIRPNASGFENALREYRCSIVEWNERLMSLKLAVRIRFRHASLWYFDTLQARLAALTSRVESYIRAPDPAVARDLSVELQRLRGAFFEFIQEMMKEARLLHRQMHFGVLLRYDRSDIDKMSTPDLIKSLFTSRIESKPIIRSPSDFGSPVHTWEARLGIYE